MKTRLLIAVLVLMMASLACSLPFQATGTPTPAPIVHPPTITVAPATPVVLVPTITPAVLTPSPTVCAYVENPGPVPADLVKRAQDAFTAAGFVGNLQVTGDGEYACDKFLLRSVSFVFSLDVTDFKDIGAMKTLAAKVKGYPVKEVLGNTNFGDIKVRFQVGKEFCWWDDVQGCGPAMPQIP